MNRRLLWVSCAVTNYPWGAETAMMDGFRRSDAWTVDVLDYRQCRRFGIPVEQRVEKLAKRYDALLIQRGEGIDLKAICETVRCPVCYFATESEANRDQASSFRQLAGTKAIVLARKKTIEQAVSLGVDQSQTCIFLLGYNGRQYRRIIPEKVDFDLALSGTITARRGPLYRQIGERLGDLKVALVQAQGDQCCRAFNSSRCVANIHSYEVLDTETRVFEVMATGALLVTECLADAIDIEGRALTFEPGDLDGLERHVRWAVSNPNLANEMTKQANQLASSYAWDGRALELLRCIDERR